MVGEKKTNYSEDFLCIDSHCMQSFGFTQSPRHFEAVKNILYNTIGAMEIAISISVNDQGATTRLLFL